MGSADLTFRHIGHHRHIYIKMISKIYLVTYNAIQTLGWSYLLYQMVTHFTIGGSVDSLYSSTSRTLNIFQTGALLEILHAGLGLVRSSVQVTFQQVWSRQTAREGIRWIVEME